MTRELLTIHLKLKLKHLDYAVKSNLPTRSCEIKFSLFEGDVWREGERLTDK